MDSDQIIKNLKSGNITFDQLPIEIRDSKEIALFIAEFKKGVYFEFISERLKDDELFFREIIKLENTNLLCNASDRIKSSKSIAILAVQYDGSSIQYFSEELRDDMELALEAIDFIDGSALSYISKRLLNEPEFIDKALKKCYHTLAFLPEEYRSNAEIISPYMAINGRLYYHLSEELKQRKDFVLCALETDPFFLKYVPYEFRYCSSCC